jgi:hypothetical protein
MATGLQRIRYSDEPNFVAGTTSGSPWGIMTFHTAIARVIVDHAVASAEAVPAKKKDLSPRRDSFGCEWAWPPHDDYSTKAEGTAKVRATSL